MEIYEYKKMYYFEKQYWWFKGLRLFIKNVFSEIAPSPDKNKVLDVGCGTGGNLELLKKLGYKCVYGLDLNSEALKFCSQRGFDNLVIGDINNIPFEDNEFNIILCSDVFECFEVNESFAYKELLRVVKPGGYILIIVAAFQFLLSEHDYAVHSVRRYTKKKAFTAFHSENTSIKMKYYFFLFFPFISFVRLMKNFFSKKKYHNPQSDLKKLPPFFNMILYYIMLFEGILSKFIPFPFGSSLFIIIRKNSCR